MSINLPACCHDTCTEPLGRTCAFWDKSSKGAASNTLTLWAFEQRKQNPVNKALTASAMLTTALAKFLVWLLERRSCTNWGAEDGKGHNLNRWMTDFNDSESIKVFWGIAQCSCNHGNPLGTSEKQCFHIWILNRTISLSLTTISSMYLVSVWTEGLRTDLLDLLGLSDPCCSLPPGGPSSSPTPPLRSRSPSSVQSGHRQEQGCSHLGTFPFQSHITAPVSVKYSYSHFKIVK